MRKAPSDRKPKAIFPSRSPHVRADVCGNSIATFGINVTMVRYRGLGVTSLNGHNLPVGLAAGLLRSSRSCRRRDRLSGCMLETDDEASEDAPSRPRIELTLAEFGLRDRVPAISDVIGDQVDGEALEAPAQARV